MFLIIAAFRKHTRLQLLLLTILCSIQVPCRSQVYLDNIPGSNDIVFPAATADSLVHFATHPAVFYAETHTVYFEPAFKFLLIRYLNTAYGMRDIFMETGHSAAWLLNRYLQTGDTTLFNNPSLVYTGQTGYYRAFWQALYHYNQTLPGNKKLAIHGADFERTEVFKVLLMLLPPDTDIPPTLQPLFDSVRTYSHDKSLTPFSPDFISKYRTIADEMIKQWTLAAKLYGMHAGIVSDIVRNPGYQSPRAPKRNHTMFFSMQQTLAADSIQRFVAFFGSAHTTYNISHSLTNAVNNLKPYRDKVLQIKSVVYNAYSNGTYHFCAGLNSHKKAAAMYNTWLNRPARAVLIPSPEKETDFLLMANDTAVVR